MFWLLEKKLTVSHVIFMWCCVTVEHDLICPAAKNKTSEPCYHESFKEIHFQLLLYICQKSSAVKRSVFLDLNFPILPPFLFSSHTFICVLWVLLVLFYCDNHEITKKNSINLCVSWNSFPPGSTTWIKFPWHVDFSLELLWQVTQLSGLLCTNDNTFFSFHQQINLEIPL